MHTGDITEKPENGIFDILDHAATLTFDLDPKN